MKSVLIIIYNPSYILYFLQDQYLIPDPEIIQICLISILCCQAGIRKIPLFIVPLFQSAVVVQLQIIFDDKRDDIIFQAFLKHDQPAHATVSILEGMDSFKPYMEIQNDLEGDHSLCLICFQ